jgi:alkanesulfonate monooxygenase SsuD/methylene tetrahydromethanopterin reductase-like flavin-dependent oxidoreductase (luciferase family)
MDLMLTCHVEAPRAAPSAGVYAEIERMIRHADDLGYRAAWFAEHHFHVHLGHMPNPILFAVHLAGKTQRISLGSAVMCVNLHQPLRLAEDIVTADVLTGGRLSIGLGSGSTPSEFAAFGVGKTDQSTEARHRRFEEFLDLLEQMWRGERLSVHGAFVDVEADPVLPLPVRPLRDVLWIAANSPAQAALAGARGYGLMLSRERTLDELQTLVGAFDGARTGGAPRPGVAASRAVFVAESDAAARDACEDAVAILVRRQRETRPQYANLPAPTSFEEACRRIQFVAGSPETVARSIEDLRARIPFSAFHIQPRWEGLAYPDVERSLTLFRREVMPAL